MILKINSKNCYAKKRIKFCVKLYNNVRVRILELKTLLFTLLLTLVISTISILTDKTCKRLLFIGINLSSMSSMNILNYS